VAAAGLQEMTWPRCGGTPGPELSPGAGGGHRATAACTREARVGWGNHTGLTGAWPIMRLLVQGSQGPVDNFFVGLIGRGRHFGSLGIRRHSVQRFR
jgi:hypothetical protein